MVALGHRQGVHRCRHWCLSSHFAPREFCQASLCADEQFISEHAPAKIRGSMIVSYSAWFNVGQLFASIALKVSADYKPLDYLGPIYTQFGLIGPALIITVFLPESPCKSVCAGPESGH